MSHKTSHNQNQVNNQAVQPVNFSPSSSPSSPSQTKQQFADTERARLAKISTRLALASNALFIAITFLAVTGLCDFALLNPNAPAKKAYADGNPVNSEKIVLSVESACSLSATGSSSHTATIANGVNKTDIGSTTLKMLCNDRNGWTLYAVGFSGDSLKTGNTNLLWSEAPAADPQENAIATGTATSGNTSNWSMKLASVSGTYAPTMDYGSTYSVVPNLFTKVAHYDVATDQTEGSSITTTYQAYISPTQGAGTYTGKVKYTLVHPSSKEPGDITTLTYMQDIDSTICEDFTTTGTTATLIDSRDGKSYSIAKLNDGKCWMTQNLDLDLDANTALTPSDSNVSADWTPERSTIPQGQLSSSTWTNDSNHPYSYDSGNTDNGNYYNWSAAIAMNDSSSITTGGTNATDSICPKGWRLPNAGTANEFGKMLYAHNVITSPTASGSSAYATNGFNILTSAPLSFLRAGYVSGGSLSNVGSRGDYWSSTAYSSTYARGLYFRSSGIDPQNYVSRHGGFSVRCVAI